MKEKNVRHKCRQLFQVIFLKVKLQRNALLLMRKMGRNVHLRWKKLQPIRMGDIDKEEAPWSDPLRCVAGGKTESTEVGWS